jgi:hypothetical protein
VARFATIETSAVRRLRRRDGCYWEHTPQGIELGARRRIDRAQRPREGIPPAREGAVLFDGPLLLKFGPSAFAVATGFRPTSD